MKFSTTFAVALAPVALARNVRNSYPANPVRRGAGSELQERTNHIVEAPAGMAPGSHQEIIIIWANPGGGAATTTINEKVTVTETVVQQVTAPPAHPAASAPPAHPPAAEAPAPPGQTHTVTVGGPGGLIFQPDQLPNVPVGDFVVFEFLSQNHTVTQSPFDTPCRALPGGMDSGFMPNPNNTVVPPPQIALQVMSSDPLWFYCRALTHCGKGMVFSINPTAEKTQAQFQSLAIAQNGTGQATPITGGQPAAPPAGQPSAAPPAGSPPAAQPPAGGVVPGQGVINPDGSCTCHATCTFNAGFPAVGNQGIGARGGVGGSIPINMAGLR